MSPKDGNEVDHAAVCSVWLLTLQARTHALADETSQPCRAKTPQRPGGYARLVHCRQGHGAKRKRLWMFPWVWLRCPQTTDLQDATATRLSTPSTSSSNIHRPDAYSYIGSCLARLVHGSSSFTWARLDRSQPPALASACMPTIHDHHHCDIVAPMLCSGRRVHQCAGWTRCAPQGGARLSTYTHACCSALYSHSCV